MAELEAKRITIDELAQLLQQDEETPIRILPDGTICAGEGKRPTRPPLTQHHYMGNEY